LCDSFVESKTSMNEEEIVLLESALEDAEAHGVDGIS
jgi:hypothetical protein